jgi:hypothetical protein
MPTKWLDLSDGACTIVMVPKYAIPPLRFMLAFDILEPFAHNHVLLDEKSCTNDVI